MCDPVVGQMFGVGSLPTQLEICKRIHIMYLTSDTSTYGLCLGIWLCVCTGACTQKSVCICKFIQIQLFQRLLIEGHLTLFWTRRNSFFSLLCHTLLLSVFSPAVLECFPSHNSQLCEITLSQINLLQWLSREETEHLQPHALIVTVELILH